MNLEIRHEALTPDALGEHGRISIAFVVDRILELTLADGGFGGMSLAETRVADPYVKDYDAIAGAAPARWAERFDVSNWGLIGALFQAAGDWARAHGCGWLKIETQNVNVAACRFYQKMGCSLGGIDRFAYPQLPGEVQLLWWKALQARTDSESS